MAKTLPQVAISQEAADVLIAAATTKAVEMGLRVAIAIVDAGGALKAFRRMDGAPLLSTDIATNKAYTAAAYGLATHVWHDFIKEDPPLLHGIVHTPRLVVFGGGFPVEVDGAIAGAIGISGGHYSQDMEIAEAALAALAAA